MFWPEGRCPVGLSASGGDYLVGLDGGLGVAGRGPVSWLGPGQAGLLDGEAVAELVHGVTGVAPDPDVFDVVSLDFLEEVLPELTVGDGLFLGIAPSVPLPVGDPALVEGVDDVLRVGPDPYRGVPEVEYGVDGAEGLDDSGEFHPVVGGPGVSAGDREPVSVPLDDGGEPAGSGVA